MRGLRSPKHLAAALGLALFLAISAPLTAFAIGQSVSPSTQTHNHGVASNWAHSWSGVSPFVVSFCPSVNTGNVICFGGYHTSTTSANRTYTFWPCVTTNFKNYAFVADDDGNGAQSNVYTHASEGGGNPC
ncbi:MAG TPA: hypothetical protein VJ850_08165 [Candidatus Limnocylindrales bacterium]|nr:hypothetical protein [Candidatus Limnocylindrales bacterium]